MKKSVYVLVVLFIASLSLGFTGGDGTAGNPYQISTRADLEAVNNDLAANYILLNDIDLSGITYSQAVIAPDTSTDSGFQGISFTGTFNGNGHIVKKLKITDSSKDYIGLFGRMELGGAFINLGVVDCNISGGTCVGGLGGVNFGGSITSCYVNGTIIGTSVYVGGLVGKNNFQGTITNCYSIGYARGVDSVGGLVGCNKESAITNSCAMNRVIGTDDVGGLVGIAQSGSITNCYSTGLVEGSDKVGGLVGYNYSGGTITSSYAAGVVSGSYGGGLCGYNSYGTITSSFWDTQTSGRESSSGGVGKTTIEMQTQATFTDAGWDFVSETVNGIEDIWQMPTEEYPKINMQMIFAGGDGTVENPYQISTMGHLEAVNSNLSSHYILINNIDLGSTIYTKAIVAPHMSTDRVFQGVKFSGSFNGNGFVIKNLTIAYSPNSYIGLFGCISISGNVSYVGVKTCNISGGDYVGGLAGYNEGTITASYTMGGVNGTTDVGGLVGYNDSIGTIENSYSDCSVNGGNVGGLVGYNYGAITNCYSTGAGGGLVGVARSGYITNCFWDIQTSGISRSYGGTGITTAQMKMQSTFINAGWDFVGELANGSKDVWKMSTSGYPKLFWRLPFGVGDGTNENPYQISNIADFETVNKDLSACYILMNDIDLTGIIYTNAVIAPSISLISLNDTKFTGVFDGNGFVIRNLKISANSIEYKNNVGLFGCVGKEGVIANLGVEDVHIVGSRFVGGLAGYSSKGTISNCHSTGQVNGELSSSVGGIVGNSMGGIISNCYSSANVNGESATIGGIAGYISRSTLISNCSASGTVTNTDNRGFGAYTGGLVGINCLGTINECSATGNVLVISDSSSDSSNDIFIGGLVGDNKGNVTKSYAKGDVNIMSTSTSASVSSGGLFGLSDESIISSCYSAGDITSTISSTTDCFMGGMIGLNFKGSVNKCYSIGAVSANQSNGCIGGLTGLNFTGEIYGCFWDVSASNQTVSAGGIGLNTEQMKSMVIYQKADWYDKGWIIDDGNDYPRLEWENISGVPISESLYVDLLGSGTAEDPYQIWTVDDFLIWQQYASVLDKHTVLMADLDLNGISVNPIGEYEPFTGTFDGNGYTIRNITIINQYNSYVGFFSRVGNLTDSRGGISKFGLITDLGIIDVNIVGFDYVGGLVGENEGKIVNCYAKRVTIGSCSYGGGLIGRNNGGVITNCYSSGEVNCTESNVGGLAGGNLGTINNCYASVSVTGSSNTGGLVGINQHVAAIVNCYSNGVVSGSTGVGGFVGYNCSNAFTNCFWDTQSSGKTVGVGYGSSTGVTGKTTDQMQDVNTFVSSGWDFDNVWLMSDYLSEFNGYPFFNWQQISTVIFDAGTNGAITSGDAIQTIAYGGSAIAPTITANPGWKFIGWDATANNITSNLTVIALYVPQTFTVTFVSNQNGALIGDVTQVISYGNAAVAPSIVPNNFWRFIGWDTAFDNVMSDLIVTAQYVNAGTGTADNPYQVSNIDELNAVNINPLSYYILVKDIDLAAITYTNAVISNFAGSFDGNGFSIKNLTIDSGLTNSIGLFGNLNYDATISNLALESCNICGSYAVGGLLGSNDGGKILNCYVSGQVTGNYFVGGLVGYDYSGAIENCYALGGVNGDWYVGGVAGSSSSSVIKNCYAGASINGNWFVGGFAGLNSNSEIISCFWDVQTSGRITSAGGEGKTIVEMLDVNTYLSGGWDFVNEAANGRMDLWYMPQGGYPRLWWQAGKGDIDYDGVVDEGDLAVMVWQWLNTPQDEQRLAADINGDGVVDLLDYVIFASNWLQG